MVPRKRIPPAIQQWPSPGKSSAARPPAATLPEPITSPDLGLTYKPFPAMPVHAVKLFQAGARIALKNIETLFFQHPGANLAGIVKGLIDATDDRIAEKEAAGDPGAKNWMLEGRKWASESLGRNWMALVGGADEAACDAWVRQRGDASWMAYDKGIGAKDSEGGAGVERHRSSGSAGMEKKDQADTALSAVEGLREVDESRLVECMVRVLERWIVLQVEAA